MNQIIININKLKQNIKTIKDATKKEIIAVVKSNAYGLNSKYIIKYLKQAKINFFAFNEIDEYLDVKDELKNNQILIMNSQKKFIDNKNIHYTINSMEDLINLKTKNKKIKIQIQIDTGMNRLGIRTMKEYLTILKEIKKSQNLELTGIYTHFSSNKLEINYYNRQKTKFLDFTKIKQLPYIHSAATSSLNKEIIGNYVRVGIALYGLPLTNNLKPIFYIKTPIINTFFVKKGEKIGYGQQIIKKNAYLSIIPLGYNEIDKIKYLTYKRTNKKSEKCHLFGKNCMNHSFIIKNFPLKKFTYLYLFLKNDTIYKDNNWYHFLISIKNIQKRYFEVKCDISKIFKTTNKKSFRIKQRRNSDKIINFRIIR